MAWVNLPKWGKKIQSKEELLTLLIYIMQQPLIYIIWQSLLYITWQSLQSSTPCDNHKRFYYWNQFLHFRPSSSFILRPLTCSLALLPGEQHLRHSSRDWVRGDTGSGRNYADRKRWRKHHNKSFVLKYPFTTLASGLFHNLVSQYHPTLSATCCPHLALAVKKCPNLAAGYSGATYHCTSAPTQLSSSIQHSVRSKYCNDWRPELWNICSRPLLVTLAARFSRSSRSWCILCKGNKNIREWAHSGCHTHHSQIHQETTW